MSDLFAFDTEASGPLLDQARANSIDSLEDIDAPAFRGLSTGIGQGIMRGGASAVRAGGIALGGLASIAGVPVEPVSEAGLDNFGKEADLASERVQDAYFKAIDDITQPAIDYWTPSANEVGRVGRILGGFGEMALPLMAGGGNPALLIGSAGVGGAERLSTAGVDAGTAVAAGTTEALATALGFKIPVLGGGLASRLATGAGGNIGFGLASRKLEKSLLESQGYEREAQNFSTTLESLSVDALTGLLFGALTHVTAPRLNPELSPSEVDALLAARNTKSFTESTAPGVPDGAASSVAHQDALELALDQLGRGEAVDVSSITDRKASFEDVATRLVENDRLIRDVEEGQPKDAPYESDLPARQPDTQEVNSESPAVSILPLQEAINAKPSVSDLPEIAALDELALQRPDARIYSGYDADGQPLESTLAETSDQIRAEYDQAVNDTNAYQAAITCFLGRGA